MSRVFLKLAFAGLRRRRLQAALVVLVAFAAAAALTVALGVGRVADRPFDRTFEATRSAHVFATSLTPRDLRPLERLPGVVASTGPRPVVLTGFRHGPKLFGLRLIGVGSKPSPVAQPLVETGAWVEPRAIVLERSFARFLHLRPGDSLVVGRTGARVRVAGIAVVSQAEPYPKSQPGLAFAPTPLLARVEPDRTRWGSLLGVRVDRPAASAAVAEKAARLLGAGVSVVDWHDDRATATEASRSNRLVLSIFGVLLLLTGGAVLATLVGGRVLAQSREIGLLKATGLRPGQVAAVLLGEQLALAVVGTTLGLIAGTFATPLFVAPSAALLDASVTPSLTAGTVLAVLAFGLGGTALFSLAPSLRIARRRTAPLLVGVVPGSALRVRLGRLSLPAPVVLGVREALGRRGRAAMTTLSLTLSVVTVVMTMGMEASLRVSTVPPPAPPLVEGSETPAWDPVDDDANEGPRLRPIVYSLDGVVLFVGAINLLAALLLGVRERVRDLGVLKAIGLTPRQLSGAFAAAQGLLGVLAVAVGIPLGLAAFRLVIKLSGGEDEFAYPAWWWLALLVPAALALVLALAAPLAHRAASIRVAEALRYE